MRIFQRNRNWREYFDTLSDQIQLADDLESIPNNCQPNHREYHRMVYQNVNNKNSFNQVKVSKNYENISDFAQIFQPLTKLLKIGIHFKWGEEQQNAFRSLKKQLIEAPVLTCPDFKKPFVLQTDASNYGLGTVLIQNL